MANIELKVSENIKAGKFVQVGLDEKTLFLCQKWYMQCCNGVAQRDLKEDELIQFNYNRNTNDITVT